MLRLYVNVLPAPALGSPVSSCGCDASQLNVWPLDVFHFAVIWQRKMATHDGVMLKVFERFSATHTAAKCVCVCVSAGNFHSGGSSGGNDNIRNDCVPGVVLVASTLVGSLARLFCDTERKGSVEMNQACTDLNISH